MSGSSITSRQHPLVQRCRRVAAGRGDPGEVLLDGDHLIRDAVAAGVPVSAVLVDDRQRDLGTWLEHRGVAVSTVSQGVIAAASPVRTPAGAVAIGAWRPAPVESLVATPGEAPVLALVDVQDPGNVGTAIRSADAFGAGGVLVLGTSANPGNWRTLRAAMGSTFRVPIGTGDTERSLAAARQAGFRIVATIPAGGTVPSPALLAPPVLVVIGGEGAGLAPAVLAAADARVTLPMRAGVESLNAATTASILLWEGARAVSPARP